MSTAEKIKELTVLISQSDDTKLINMVYALVKEYQQKDEITLSKEQQTDLQLRVSKRKNGDSKQFTWEEIESKLKAI